MTAQERNRVGTWFAAGMLLLLGLFACAEARAADFMETYLYISGVWNTDCQTHYHYKQTPEYDPGFEPCATIRAGRDWALALLQEQWKRKEEIREKAQSEDAAQEAARITDEMRSIIAAGQPSREK